MTETDIIVKYIGSGIFGLVGGFLAYVLVNLPNTKKFSSSRFGTRVFLGASILVLFFAPSIATSWKLSFATITIFWFIGCVMSYGTFRNHHYLKD